MNIDSMTKYERARIIGARALQLAMGAPILVKLTKKDMEEIKYNPIIIARRELEKGVIPLSIKKSKHKGQ